MKLLNFCIFVFLLVSIITIADGGSVGINYGRLGNDLPPPADVVKLIKSTGFHRAKIFDVNPAVLRAFSGSGIKLTVCLPNENITIAARNPNFADKWVSQYIAAAYHSGTLIEAIAVGNEVLDDKKNPGVAANLVNAMENIHNALKAHNLEHKIKVSSPLSYGAITNSYPPQAAEFTKNYLNIIKPMLSFLSRIKSPLMMNVYPYFAYKSDQTKIPRDYALFRAPNLVGQTKYPSLFHAMVDGVFAAMEKLNYGNVRLVITETGWPSGGGGSTNPTMIAESIDPATVANAAAYNLNLVKSVLNGGGTPMRPKANLTVYIFALFNENNKPGELTEKNFGLFYPDKRKVYSFVLPAHGSAATDHIADHDETDGMTTMPTEHDTSHAVPVDSHHPNPHEFTRVTETEFLVDRHSENHDGMHKPTHGQSWCVAKKGVSKDMLQKGLNWVCNKKLSGGVHCSKIQIGEKCYEPNTLMSHASHAFNHYYQMHKHAPGSCNFDGAAHIVHKEPNYGGCKLHYKE